MNTPNTPATPAASARPARRLRLVAAAGAVVASSIAGVAATSTTPAAAQNFIGPVTVQAGFTVADLSFATAGPAAATLRVMSLNPQVVVFTASDLQQGPLNQPQNHNFHVTGLSPNTKYLYHIKAQFSSPLAVFPAYETRNYFKTLPQLKLEFPSTASSINVSTEPTPAA